MHVLPLPFGLALALMPRREATQLRRAVKVRDYVRTAITPQRERILGDVRFSDSRHHII
jgi:hypothetical protein